LFVVINAAMKQVRITNEYFINTTYDEIE
jgi:hypothetical protein